MTEEKKPTAETGADKLADDKSRVESTETSEKQPLVGETDKVQKEHKGTGAGG